MFNAHYVLNFEPEFEMEEKDNTQPQQRPVAGMRALGLGAFCAFGVFVISIVIGMSSVLAGKKLIVEKSSDAPLEFNYEGASKELAVKTMEKFQSFAEQAQGDSKLEFSLGIDELNSLVAFNENFKDLKNYVQFVEIGEDLYANISYPIERIEGLEETGKGKFLNGKGKFAVYVKKREFKIQLMEVTQNGEPLQIDSIAAVQQFNLLRHFSFYGEMESRLNLVADVIYKDGRLFVRNWRDIKKTR